MEELLKKYMEPLEEKINALYKMELDALDYMEKLKAVIDSKTKNEKVENIPTFEEVMEHFEKNGYTISPEKFYDYNNKRKWMLNGEVIKDWKKLAESWEKRQRN